MFIADALCRTPEIKPIFTHHEQSAGMSADAYSRMTGKLGLAVVTAGPGAMNITNGLVGGFMDSAPMMIVSGQSNYSCVKYMDESGIRQYGVQGINIRPFVEAATKFFVTVDDPSKIKYYMEKAYYLAFAGRPGPVWIDVPLDIQRMEVPERLLSSYVPDQPTTLYADRKANCVTVIDHIKEAKRPLIIAGQGIRLGNALQEFLSLVEQLRVPVITTRLGIDLINSDHELYVGRPGNYGERSANIAIQNADLILVLGSRLSTSSIGHDASQFGKNAKIIAVEIDPLELNKPGANLAIKICDDVKKFIACLLDQLPAAGIREQASWTSRCRFWKEKYPVVLPEYEKEQPVNSYYFTQQLSALCDDKTAVLVDTGSCFHVACQAWKVKLGQRFLTTGGLSSMGYWAAVIGACAANNYQNTIVITGDGSLQMNLQELATIKNLNKPIKIFILNNNGYLLIRQTQRNFMESRFFGEGPNTGVYCPDSIKIAEAYGIKAVKIETPEETSEKIKEVLAYDGPVVCDVITPEWQLIIPRVSSDKMPDGTLVSRKYEDMFPYLPPEEMAENMKN
jgi:acetolactate synthase-1/2/3 large subunit